MDTEIEEGVWKFLVSCRSFPFLLYRIVAQERTFTTEHSQRNTHNRFRKKMSNCQKWKWWAQIELSQTHTQHSKRKMKSIPFTQNQARSLSSALFSPLPVVHVLCVNCLLCLLIFTKLGRLCRLWDIFSFGDVEFFCSGLSIDTFWIFLLGIDAF